MEKPLNVSIYLKNGKFEHLGTFDEEANSCKLLLREVADNRVVILKVREKSETEYEHRVLLISRL